MWKQDDKKKKKLKQNVKAWDFACHIGYVTPETIVGDWEIFVPRHSKAQEMKGKPVDTEGQSQTDTQKERVIVVFLLGWQLRESSSSYHVSVKSW